MKGSEREINYKSRSRLDWIDFARGLSIILVALMHSSLCTINISHNADLFWWKVSEFLAPIRIPLFFVISGYLSANTIKRPWNQNLQRTLGLYILYVFWTALFLARLLIPAARGGQPLPDATDFLLALVLPTSFWYIWALPVFHTIAWCGWKLFREKSSYIIIPMTILTFFSVFVDGLSEPVLSDPLDALKLGSITRNGVWFFVGIHFKTYWDTLIALASPKRLIMTGCAYAACTLLILSLDHDYLYVLKTPLAILALLFMANVLGLLNYSNAVARFVSWVGSKTLPVYIFHIFAISVISAIIRVSGFAPFVAEHAFWFDVFASVVICGVVVTLARIGGDILEAIGLKAMIYPLKFQSQKATSNPQAVAD